MHRLALPNGAMVWQVTGHAEVRALMADPRLVKPGPRHGPFAKQLPPEVANGIHHNLLYVNPPDHTRLRKLVTVAFTRRRLDSLAPYIQELTDTLLDATGDAEEVDLLPALAYPLPIAVIGKLLGIPPEAESDFRHWTAPLMSPAVVGYKTYAENAEKFLGFLRGLVAAKRQAPTDDLLSDLGRSTRWRRPALCG